MEPSAGTLLEPPLCTGTPAGTPAGAPLSALEPLLEPSFVRFWSFLGIQHSSSTFVSPLFPCISSHMPLLPPLVDCTKAARAAMGTSGYAGPDRLGCTDLAAHPDTKVVIPPGTTIARIRLTRPFLATDTQPCALTDWLHGVPMENPEVPIPQVRLHVADVDDVIQACTGRANPTVNKTQRRHVGMEGTTLLFAALKPTTKKAVKDKYTPSSTPTLTPFATWWTTSPPCNPMKSPIPRRPPETSIFPHFSTSET